jgi:hypothetical protein
MEKAQARPQPQDARLARAQAFMTQGHAALTSWHLDAAAAAFRQAAALAPNSPLPLTNLGTALHLAGDLPAAERALRKALALDPSRQNTAAELGFVLMGQGRLSEGLRHWPAWRAASLANGKGAPDLPLPLWQGENIAGKRLLVWSEHGFGDQIMWARFAPVAESRGAQVQWLCPPELLRLFREGMGLDAIPSNQNHKLKADYFIPCSGLPYALRVGRSDLSGAPYIRQPAARRLPGARIGVKAQGNPALRNNHNRSLSPAEAAELLAIPGAVDLSPEATGARDFWETAEIVAGLDLVISVDTSVAHLAGALGKPVWIMLPAQGSDWRWVRGRDDSPWYASARLFRQPAPGCWGEVVQRLKAEAVQ